MLWPRWSQVKTKARALLLSVCSPEHCLVMFFPVKVICNLRRRATTLLPPTVYKIYLYLSFGGRNLSPFSFTKWVWLPTSHGRREIFQSRHSCLSLFNKWKENLGNNMSFLKKFVFTAVGGMKKKENWYIGHSLANWINLKTPCADNSHFHKFQRQKRTSFSLKFYQVGLYPTW